MLVIHMMKKGNYKKDPLKSLFALRYGKLVINLLPVCLDLAITCCHLKLFIQHGTVLVISIL